MAERQRRAPKAETETAEEDILDPRAVQAYDYLTNKFDGKEVSIVDLYDQDAGSSLAKDIALNLRREDNVNVLYMAELLLGDGHADPRFLYELLEQVKSLPEEMKPDAVVMSGLMMGELRGYKKSLRPSLQHGLRSLDEQLFHARKILDDISSALEVPVVYAMGDDDLRIVKEMTQEGFAQVEELASKRAKHSSADPIMKAQLTKAGRREANPKWAEYYDVTRDVVFPYCLRAGRTLYTAEEVADLTNGECDLPERELLHKAYKLVQNRKPLTDIQNAILDVAALRDSAELTVTGDFNHTVKTKKNTYNDRVEHNTNFSDTSVPSTYLTKLRGRRGATKANGEDFPDNLITMQNQEAMGFVFEGNEGIHSIGALQDPFKDVPYKGAIDKTRRMRNSRGRVHPPSATQIERTDDGRHIITLHNRALWEKSESVPERTAIVMHCDWQMGSVSARPDLQIKHLDMTRRMLGRMPVVIALGGDFLHGRNYSDFPRESQRTGLMSMDAQEEVVRNMVQMSIESMTKDEVDNMLKVLVQIGNHEWNSGTLKWHGYSYATYLRSAYESAFIQNGYSFEEAKKRVQFHDTIVTPSGEPIRTYSAVDKIGEVGLEVRHFFGRGAGGLTPLSAQKQTAGVGDLKAGIDIMMYGHYHHPAYMLDNNKIIVGAGSLAGMTGFEYELGLRSVPSAVTMYIGGGLPPQIEFIGEETFHKYKIPDGPFSDKEIRESHGYRNDRSFDAGKHTPYLDMYSPKSALQKLILEIGHKAAYSTETTGYLPEAAKNNFVSTSAISSGVIQYH